MEFTEWALSDEKKQDLKSERGASFVLCFSCPSPFHPPAPIGVVTAESHPSERPVGGGSGGKDFALGTRGRKRSYRSVVVVMGQKVSVAGLWEPGLPVSLGLALLTPSGGKADGQAAAVSCCWCRNDVVRGDLRALCLW